MGILNLTPDSFFEPSRYNMEILTSGADIVDIGAVSTRPGAAPVSVDEEWRRLEPVLKKVAESRSAFPEISVDTTSSLIVRSYKFLYQWVFRCQYHEGCTIKCVRSCSEDSHLVFTSIEGEVYLSTYRSADPVLLHELNLFRPARKSIEIVKKSLGIVSDLKVPL